MRSSVFALRGIALFEVDRLFDAGAVELEIVNYRVSVTLTCNALDR